MGKITKINCNLDNHQLTKKIKQTKGFWRVQKWLIIYNAKNYPRKAEEIAKHLNVSKSLVHKTIYEYNKKGKESIEKKGKGGRWHSYMAFNEEVEFIKPFIDAAKKGDISTVQEIKHEFERKINKSVHKTTIYRLLKRHNWRKIVPRPKHPKSEKNTAGI